MFSNVVFVYISDDLEWGRKRIGTRAKTRNINIYFVGDEKGIEHRQLDRDRCII